MKRSMITVVYMLVVLVVSLRVMAFVSQSFHRAACLPTLSMSNTAILSNRIKEALQIKFPRDRHDISRVVTCWDDFVAGKRLERYLDDDKEVLQR